MQVLKNSDTNKAPGEVTKRAHKILRLLAVKLARSSCFECQFSRIVCDITSVGGANSRSRIPNSRSSFQYNGAHGIWTGGEVSYKYDKHESGYRPSFVFCSRASTPPHRVRRVLGRCTRIQKLRHRLRMLMVESQLQRSSSLLRSAAAIRHAPYLSAQVSAPPPALTTSYIPHLHRSANEKGGNAPSERPVLGSGRTCVRCARTK